jgi:hypothetical protein
VEAFSGKFLPLDATKPEKLIWASSQGIAGQPARISRIQSDFFVPRVAQGELAKKL